MPFPVDFLDELVSISLPSSAPVISPIKPSLNRHGFAQSVKDRGGKIAGECKLAQK
jgi:hypothetical protein